ncbi:MAG: SbcC/MukB-like Walker B domain-containing protein, partial [Candidatus Promineifilaceae bacterium]
QAEIAFLNGCQEAIPIYFAGKKWQLLKEAVAAAQKDLETAQVKLNQLEEQLNRFRKQETDLQIAISSDETGRRLRELEQEIKYVRQSQQRKEADAIQYDKIAQALHLSPYKNETAFTSNRQDAAGLIKKVEQQLETAAEQLRESQIAENELGQERESIQQELESLSGRTSQIPSQNLHLRNRILDALTIAEADVPFVGELLAVKDSERGWEGAIERLLHNLGLRLLVPERHYGRFARYVNENNLNGRLIFHRVPEDGIYSPHQPDNSNALRHKLEIKPDTAYYDWLDNELIERYDYTCCETMANFDRAQRAITQTGLSKSGGHDNARYEKDDRHRIDDRRTYILGWRNQEKIRALEDELADIEKRLQEEKRRINQVKTTQQQAGERKNLLDNLLTFTDFAQLDWRSDAVHIQQLEAQKTRLEQSSNRLQQLQNELSQIQEQSNAVSQERTGQARTVSQLEYQVSVFLQEIEQAKKDTREADDATMAQYAPRIKEQVQVSITLENVDRLWRDVLTHFQQASKTEQNRAASHMGRLLKLMQEYKDAYPAETADFDAAVESIPEYDRELARIERDDLPKYTERFRRMRDEKVIEAIALFQADLYKYVEEIEENIADLNQSLQTIDYTPDTYIQLQTENSRDPEIREFRQLLKDCLADVGQQRTEGAYEASFIKVRDLITRFKEDIRWTGKVTDVRQWLNFAAIERYRSDDSEKHYYSDSSGKSGGQKAKLAYTILASAIAFQFGLERGETKSQSFRFVVVDEAFSRSDEKNSRYAMQLFKELDLQLLVVTPMTGI